MLLSDGTSSIALLIPAAFTLIDDNRFINPVLLITRDAISSIVGGINIVTFTPKNDTGPTLGEVMFNPFGEGKYTVVKLVAPLNALKPMLVTPAGMLIEVKLDAPRNALFPMLVTFAEMLIEVKPVA